MRKKICFAMMVMLAAVPVWGDAPEGGPPPTGGTISIEPQSVDGQQDPAMPVFVDAVSQALTAKGFTVFEDQGHAGAVVELVLSRTQVGQGFDRVQGQRAASMIGAGVSVPLSTGNSQSVRLQRTRLEMRIRKRGETGLVWDGAAVTVREAGIRNGTSAAVAHDLAQALLQAYPVQPKDALGVP